MLIPLVFLASLHLGSDGGHTLPLPPSATDVIYHTLHVLRVSALGPGALRLRGPSLEIG